MARSIDSDYIDFSHMSGFDMGIDFDGFEENVRKFMEVLPAKYLDSAHDKAVEFIEDVQAIIFAPFTDDEVPNEEDQSSSSVITESSPTSVETALVGPNTEASTPASLITVENRSTGCVDTDAHGTESFSRKSTDSSEEVILWNPETSVKPRPLGLTAIPQDDHAPHALETDQVAEQAGHCSGHSDSSVCDREIPLENFRADYEEEAVLHSANDPVEVTIHDSTTITQDDYVPHILHKDQQAGLDCSVHSDTLVDSAAFFQALLLEDSSANYEDERVSYSANGPVEATQDNYVPQALNKEEKAGLHCSGYSDILVDSAVFFQALLQEDYSANCEDERVSYSANGSVEATQDNYVPQALNKEEQAGLHCSGHSDILVDSAVFFEALLLEDSSANSEEQMVSHGANGPVEATTHGTSISHESSSDVPSCADVPNMPTDTMVKSVDIEDLRDGQEHMENDEIVPPVPQRNNASFQKMFMRSLSSKLRWSKKQVSTRQAMPAGSQDSENIGYQLVSSSADLEHDWEVL
ncbi:uncharacterized protein LOC112894876 isoform X2 [Panicum hallii]|uniref:uncharacterized protein LOC112894876 isoform X2 n=1 Tax=Panicum hallii TaxID=206008 RepID=UPI000DF4DA7B|nr:uncharacterized protein LOC112894876 isoform X2 [Panicum hallii]